MTSRISKYLLNTNKMIITSVVRRSVSNVVVASKSPFCETLTAGTKYSWCACGLSKKQPFCDGSHRGSGMKPYRMKAEENCEVFFCGCKHTKTPPYCDGSHMSDGIQACQVGEKL